MNFSEYLTLLLRFSSLLENPRTSTVLQWLPRDEREKEVAISATEGPSPPVIERPIAGRDLSLLIKDCRLSFKADFWLSLDEPKNDQL